MTFPKFGLLYQFWFTNVRNLTKQSTFQSDASITSGEWKGSCYVHRPSLLDDKTGEAWPVSTGSYSGTQGWLKLRWYSLHIDDFPFAAEIFVSLMLGQRPIKLCFYFLNTILYVCRKPSLRSTCMISIIIY